MLIPVTVMCVRDPVGGRVALLASPAVAPHGVAALITFATGVTTIDRFVTGIGARGGRTVTFVPVHSYVVSPLLVMWALYLVLAVAVVGLGLGTRAIRRHPSPSPA